jgi:hypothetical protein
MAKLRPTLACGPYDDHRVCIEDLFAPSTLRDIPVTEGYLV